MLIENQRAKFILESIDALEEELAQIRNTCQHIKGPAEYIHYDDGEGHKHTYINYDCILCGEWMEESE